MNFIYVTLKLLVLLTLYTGSSFGQLVGVGRDSLEFTNSKVEFPVIRSSFGKYYVKHKKVTTKYVTNVLANSDSVAFKQFFDGKQQMKIGASVAFAGAAMSIIGVFVTIGQVFSSITSPSSESSNSGENVLLEGSAISLAGVTVLVLGKHKKNRAVKLYNNNNNIGNRSLEYNMYLKPSLNNVVLGLSF